jgi:hypothetical protein
MGRFDAGSVVRQRLLRLKKRKTVQRRQQSLREKMLLAKHESVDRLTDTLEPSAEIESTKEQDQ